MTWRKYSGSGWNSLGPMIAMMATQAANEWERDARTDRAISRRDRKD